MAHIRKIAELEEITEAEQALIEACKAGEECDLGGLPEEGDKSREIRADLLRFLILGGCEGCRVREGIKLGGATITGTLDLSFQNTKGPIWLFNCRFQQDAALMQTRCDGLILNGSHLKALNAQGAEVRGNVFLKTGFFAQGGVNLSGAIISGQFSSINGRFTNPDGHALNAQGVEVKGSVFLSDGFQAEGEVRLSGAQISGQLDCSNGSFSNPDDDAFNAQGMSVSDGFIWRDVSTSEGNIYFDSAKVGGLADDLASWPNDERVYLNGFTYNNITGATDATTRLKWLARGDKLNGRFYPQPYVQLAKVLREMGHERDARAVLYCLNVLRRENLRKRATIDPDGSVQKGLASFWSDITNAFRLLWDYTQRHSIGYGLRPLLSLRILSILFLAATLLAHQTWNEGSFAPNSGPILVSDAWQLIATDKDIANPADHWSTTGQPGQDWESFNRYA